MQKTILNLNLVKRILLNRFFASSGRITVKNKSFYAWLLLGLSLTGSMICSAQARLHPSLIPVADNLTVPWDIEWLGNEKIIFTEKDGRIGQVDLKKGTTATLYKVADVAVELQSGLLGLQLHPQYPQSPLVYIAYTVYQGDQLVLKLSELTFEGGQLIFSKDIVQNIPAAATDVGGRFLITSDQKIYISVGDNENSETAQNLASLNGKILRYNLDGSIPADNPFPNSPVWAMGIRNSQGLTEANGMIFFTEHGTMSDDELNLLVKGGNYGWQLVAGHCDQESKSVCENIKHQEPIVAWTPTVAPAGLAYYNHDRYPALKNSLLVAELFDETLHVLKLDKKLRSVKEQSPLISEEIGRLRDVLTTSDGRVFVATSNADAYGAAHAGSDGIFEIKFNQEPPRKVPPPLNLLSSAVADDTLQLDSTMLEIRILTDHLLHPWDMTWGFDGHIWFTENGGYVKRLNPVDGKIDTMLHLQDCHFSWGNPGIYSLAFHPHFPKEPYLYLHYTNSATNSKLTRWRYDFDNDALTDSIAILPAITANESHNGSRIVFTPDDKMFFAMGEAYTPELAQDLSSLNGKILRLNLDGSVPDDNPFPGSLIWSYGHRNPQGLALLPNGTLWSSEHGANNDDELNIIYKGQNYGWPKVQGFCDLRSEERFCIEQKVVQPIIAWTPTVAPCALEYYNHPAIPEWQNCLFQVFLKKGKGKKGQRLTVFQLGESGRQINNQTDYFTNTYGRLRDVLFAPDGRVFMCTSNKEISGNGKKVVKADDDKIIELRPVKK
ncbi:MAG: PQQ-dependent sugar dehydrogenase [Bacteroidota bacterium]